MGVSLSLSLRAWHKLFQVELTKHKRGNERKPLVQIIAGGILIVLNPSSGNLDRLDYGKHTIEFNEKQSTTISLIKATEIALTILPPRMLLHYKYVMPPGLGVGHLKCKGSGLEA